LSIRILLTNDDGVDAPGLEVLREIAGALSNDVWVVAPEGNQSGAGHRFSFARELGLEQRDERTFAVTGGSPADCVVAGCTHLLGDKLPDLVLSGVNNGQNLGDILHCSGTVAGAREGALQGIIGIALSQAVDYSKRKVVDWTNATQFGGEVVRQLFAEARRTPSRDTYFNVNFPFCAPEEVSGIRIAAHQRFSRSPMRYFGSENVGNFFIAIPETPLPLDPEADFHLLHHSNAVTVTPLTLLQTDEAAAERLAGRLAL
jgi:5'-nucleotidase